MSRVSMVNVGDVFDVWWKVISVTERDDSDHCVYKLRNMANGMEIDVNDFTMRNIAKKKTSVSKVMFSKITYKTAKADKKDRPYYSIRREKFTKK